MLEPQHLFPRSLGIEWGWTQQQCHRALSVPILREDSQFITVEVQVDGKPDTLSLGFGSTGWGVGGGFDSVQAGIDLPRELDPSWFVEDEGQPEGDDEDEWKVFYEDLESRQQNVRDLFEAARVHYSKILGPTELYEDKDRIGDYSLVTHAAIGWRLPEGDLEILLNEEDTSEWMFLSVRVDLYPPGTEAFWFARRAPKPKADPSTSIRKHIPPPNLPVTLPPPKPWWRIW